MTSTSDSEAAAPHSLTPRFDPPLPSAFDHEGAKPDCYAEHAKLVPAVQDFMPPTSVVELARATPPLSDRANVYRIGPDTIVKVHEYYPCAEAFNLSMIRAMTTIPVPELRQVVKHKNDTYLVMEYLRGRTLARCWSALRSSERLRIAETLRGYIAQLRTLRRAVPGALDGSACNGPFFPPDGAGPFASYAEFVDWFNHKGDVAKSTGKAPSDLGTFDDASPLVFTHQDLSMRNILLANDGTVYLIDWEWSGFYPEWMEYACMARNQDTPQTWKDLIPFITGPHQDTFELLCNVSWTIVVGRDM
ncbi:kinase-like domain-containing protein [Sparassis latifolia]